MDEPWRHDTGPHESVEAAREAAVRTVAELAEEKLELLATFVLPPADGAPSRDFQTLHLDFGIPLKPGGEADLVSYTALHVPAGTEPSGARTRLVPLAALLRQREWPPPAELRRRFAAYAQSHGRQGDGDGCIEGSLARIVEAASSAIELPSMRADPGFLCGLEFGSVAAEEAFLAARGLRLEGVVTEVVIEPGQLLVFDNRALAHGRVGRRQPGEMLQWAFGRRRVGPEGQNALLAQILSAFAAS